MISEGKNLKRKTGAIADKLKTKATRTAIAASRKVKKVAKKAKPSTAVRPAGKLERAVGSVIGKAIGTVEKAVNGVIKKCRIRLYDSTCTP
ncbi:MAG: hypothetical protein QM706_09845 [Nitrospira sp.]